MVFMVTLSMSMKDWSEKRCDLLLYYCFHHTERVYLWESYFHYMFSHSYRYKFPIFACCFKKPDFLNI